MLSYVIFLEENHVKKLVSQSLVVVAGLMAVPGNADPQQTQSGTYQQDPRLHRIRTFFSERRSPAHRYAADFVRAADRNNLDWRLLPSISFLESGGGKAYKNNNIFGWDNCERRFRSVPHGIHTVADRLANSDLYKDKDLDAVLRTYNPRKLYRAKVKAVMAEIGPSQLALFPIGPTLN
ncbi:MAG TPA: hypothetical protein DEH78_16510 [Solibacterales bacterium]|nr:hypothetical protein [Bryobacterales bacterium]